MKAEYIDHMGSDLTVVNAARVSFDKESDWEYQYQEEIYLESRSVLSYKVAQDLKEKDKKLIKYLSNHGHWTPFAHPQITIRETVPIFVARQRFKHMVGFIYNEVSRRYVDDGPEFFEPEGWRDRPKEGIKQGSGDRLAGKDSIEGTCLYGNYHTYNDIIDLCKNWYEEAIDMGIAPEQARMILPQSMYTSYYVTGSLAAWARAYRQRIDLHAQKEIQDLAMQWNNIIQPLFPESWRALTTTE